MMKFLYVCLFIYVFEIQTCSCFQNSSQIEYLMERLTAAETRQVMMEKKFGKELAEAKQQIKNLQTQSNLGCKLNRHMHSNSSDQKRSFLPGSAVGFTACVSVSDLTNFGLHHTIRFDRLITNRDGAYHATTGIFTAPYRGLYGFAVTAMSKAGKKQYLNIVKDGIEMNSFLADANESKDYEVTGNQWVIELNQGSDVWIQTDHAGEIHGNCYTLFSGFLLSEIE